jgi:hypothetical protein
MRILLLFVCVLVVSACAVPREQGPNSNTSARDRTHSTDVHRGLGSTTTNF